MGLLRTGLRVTTVETGCGLTSPPPEDDAVYSCAESCSDVLRNCQNALELVNVVGGCQRPFLLLLPAAL